MVSPRTPFPFFNTVCMCICFAIILFILLFFLIGRNSRFFGRLRYIFRIILHKPAFLRIFSDFHGGIGDSFGIIVYCCRIIAYFFRRNKRVFSIYSGFTPQNRHNIEITGLNSP